MYETVNFAQSVPLASLHDDLQLAKTLRQSVAREGEETYHAGSFRLLDCVEINPISNHQSTGCTLWVLNRFDEKYANQ